MSKVLWVAEIGSMHNGDKSLAYELIRQAKMSGATIAKFQLGWSKEAQLKYAGNYDERRYIDHWAEDLAEWCNHFDIEFVASIWSLEGLEVARSVDMRRYKIAHQVHDEELIDAIFEDKKPVFWSNPRVARFRGDFSHIVAQKEYPARTYINMDYDFTDGYSSHMSGIGDALIAVAHGAKYIEKHFALSNVMDWPRDATFALLPSEFKTMVEVGEQMAALL